jgi:hypothetical protein
MTTMATAASRSTVVPWRIVIIVALPVLTLVVIAAILAGEAIGVHPWASPPPATVSEAAAIGAAYQAIALIRQGQDPSAAGQLPPGVIDRNGYNLTPIDAAIVGRRLEMIALLRAHGAQTTHPGRSVCLAHATGLPEAVPLLVDSAASGADAIVDRAQSVAEALQRCDSRK